MEKKTFEDQVFSQDSIDALFQAFRNVELQTAPDTRSKANLCWFQYREPGFCSFCFEAGGRFFFLPLSFSFCQ